MLNKILKKEKPRVFLGTLTVAPRADIKRHLDQWGMFKNEDSDSSIRQNLKEIFSLSPANEVSEPKSNDLVLDVVVPKFQSGDAWDLSLGDFGIPLMWRPKITVSSRLYYLKSEKTKDTFSVTEKMKLGQYISRLFTWRAILRFRPVFDSKDMEYLLYQACLEDKTIGEGTSARTGVGEIWHVLFSRVFPVDSSSHLLCDVVGCES